MIYSKECEYAIRALTYLTRHADQRCLAKTIAAQEDLPHHFLSKILQSLAKEKLLNSVKGPNGGFQLAKPPQSVSLYQIKKLIDGLDQLDECAVGLARCNDKVPCPLHEQFKPVREKIKAYLKNTTLKDMAQALERKDNPPVKITPQ